MVKAIGGAAWHWVLRHRGQGLHLNQQRACAFHCYGNSRAGRIHHALGQKGFAGVSHFGHATAGHFKHAHFVGGPKAVFDRAQQPKSVKTVAF